MKTGTKLYTEMSADIANFIICHGKKPRFSTNQRISLMLASNILRNFNIKNQLKTPLMSQLNHRTAYSDIFHNMNYFYAKLRMTSIKLHIILAIYLGIRTTTRTSSITHTNIRSRVSVQERTPRKFKETSTALRKPEFAQY